jgi:chromosome segregation ATPase
MKEQIEEWLQTEPKDYQKGIELLNQVHHNKVMIRFISGKKTIANLDRVIYHLGNFVGKPYVPLMKPEIESKPIRLVAKEKPEVSSPSVKVEQISNAPDELIERKRGIFSQRNKLSQAIQEASQGKTDLPDEVKQMVKDLLAIDEQIKAIDSQINHWNQYGKLPDAPKEEIPENKELQVTNEDEKSDAIAKIKKLIKNQLTYVTKAKAKFDKHPENLRFAEDLEKKRLELKRLTLLKEQLQSFSF